MKRFYGILFFSLLLNQGVFAQAIERSVQEGNLNSINDALWLNDTLLVISEESSDFNYFTTSRITAYNQLFEEQWSVNSPVIAEVYIYHEFLPYTDSTFLTVSSYQIGCDFSEPFAQILEFNFSGDLINTYPIGVASPVFNTSVALTDWGFTALTQEFLYLLDNEGIETGLVPNNSWEQVYGLGDHFLLRNNSKLYLLDSTADILDSLEFSGEYADMAVLHDTLIAVLSTDNSVATYNIQLEGIESVNLSPQENLSKIIIDGLGFMVYGSSDVVYLDADLNQTDAITFSSIEGFHQKGISRGSEYHIIYGHKQSTAETIFNVAHTHGAFRSISRDGNVLNHNPDLELVSMNNLALSTINIDDVTASYSFSADVTVINTGDVAIEGFFINHIVSEGICIPEISHSYYEEALLSGEEITLNFAVDNGFSFIDPSDPIIEVCAFVTLPGNYIDRVQSNDRGCSAAISLGADNAEPASFKLYPNPASNFVNIQSDVEWKAYRIFDLSGRTVKAANFRNNLIDLSDLPSGLFLLELESDDMRAMEKIIIRK